jgi:hypothetical protein
MEIDNSTNCIEIDNIIDHELFQTFLIPFENTKIVNVVILNDIQISEQFDTVKDIIKKINVDFVYISTIYKNYNVFTVPYIYVQSIYSWMSELNKQKYFYMYRNKLIDYINKNKNRDIVVIGSNQFINSLLTSIYVDLNAFFICLDDSNININYKNFVISSNNLNEIGDNLNYLLGLSYRLNDEYLMCDNKYFLKDIDDNSYYCLSVLKPNDILIEKTKIKIKNTNNLYDQINIIGIKNLIVDSKIYLINNIKQILNVIKCFNKLDNDMCAFLNNKLSDNILTVDTLVNHNFSYNLQEYSIFKLLNNMASKNKYKFNKLNNNVKKIININNNIKKANNDIKNMCIWLEKLQKFNENENFEKSCDLYNYLISMTSWYEELESCNIGGILLSVRTPKLAKMGITLDNVIINEISNNLITFEQICDAQNIFMDENNNYDDGRNTKNAIKGSVIGNGNAILPLYINKYHWSLVELQLNYCLGVMINQNPYDYYQKFYDIYPMVLFNYTKQLITDKNNINNKSIVIFIQLIITVNKIFQKYNYKINGMSINQINDHFVVPENRTEKHYDNLDKLLGFTILSNNHCITDQINIIQNLLDAILLEYVRRKYKLISNTNDDNNEVINVKYILDKIFESKISYGEYLKNKKNYDFLINNYIYDKITNNSYDINELFNMIIIEKKSNYWTMFIESLDKLLCWSIVNNMSNEKTAKYLNDVLNDDLCNISDECIEYFKGNLMNMNKLYNENLDNRLKYFVITNNYDLINKIIYLNTIFTIDNKYISENYKFNPLVNRPNFCSFYSNNLIKLLTKVIDKKNKQICNLDDNDSIIHINMFIEQFIKFMCSTLTLNDINKILSLLINNTKSDAYQYNTIINCIVNKIREQNI